MRQSLTKKDIVNSVYMQLGYSKKVSEILIEDFFDLIIDELIKNKIVKISKFVSNFDMCLNKTIDWYLLNENFYKSKKIFLQRQGLIKKK